MLTNDDKNWWHIIFFKFLIETVTNLVTHSYFRWWLADWNIIFVDFWWFSLFTLISCNTFTVVENWCVSRTSTARLNYIDDVMGILKMTSQWCHMMSRWKLPGMDCRYPLKQFHRHQETYNLQHRNLENHKFLDKDISLLSSLSAHNLKKKFSKL